MDEIALSYTVSFSNLFNRQKNDYFLIQLTEEESSPRFFFLTLNRGLIMITYSMSMSALKISFKRKRCEHHVDRIELLLG